MDTKQVKTLNGYTERRCASCKYVIDNEWGKPAKCGFPGCGFLIDWVKGACNMWEKVEVNENTL